MTDLAASRREQYARYQPVFWRPAADARDKHRTYLAGLVADSQVITLVSEEHGQVTGFLIATLVPDAGHDMQAVRTGHPARRDINISEQTP